MLELALTDRAIEELVAKRHQDVLQALIDARKRAVASGLSAPFVLRLPRGFLYDFLDWNADDKPGWLNTNNPDTIVASVEATLVCTLHEVDDDLPPEFLTRGSE